MRVMKFGVLLATGTTSQIDGSGYPTNTAKERHPEE
jgi:hypothetical protein